MSIFGFWTSGPGPFGAVFPQASHRAWQAFDSGFTVFGDADVVAALTAWSPAMVELYRDIGIAACRSDIARLALLHAHGGTYVDAHTAPGVPELLDQYLDRASRCEMMIPQLDRRESPIPFNRIFNSPLSAQPGGEAVALLLRRACGNLLHWREIERQAPAAPGAYSIFDLTGPNMIRDRVVDYGQQPAAIRPEFASAVRFFDIDRTVNGPFRMFLHSDYRQGAVHWTKREKLEPLFLSRAGR